MIRINSCKLAFLFAACIGALGLQFEAISAPVFVSNQPAARVEHWQKRQANINTYLRESKDLGAVKLLFVGDSITDFWLFDDNPWVSGQKYGRKIWDASFAKPGRDNFAFNIGISGDRLEHVLHRILPTAQGGLGQLDSPQLNPEFIMVMLGINNSWAVEHPVADSIYEGVLANLRALHARKPNARIVLQSLLPTNDPAKNNNVVLVVNQRLKALALQSEFSEFTIYLDLYPLFTDTKGIQISNYFTDGLHPNADGYAVWRDRLLDFLNEARAATSKSGRLERMPNMASQYVDARHVDVWLPDGFDELKAAGKKFNVIYMHNGQMLFDPKTTWNKQAWHVDSSIQRLMKTGQIGPTLVVGVWNNGKFRHSEYFPQKYLPNMPADVHDEYVQKALQNKPQSDAYLKFLVNELKPAIDARYPTLSKPSNTFIMGSSMGGLISLYAMNEYPDVFGGAAGLSTHWMGGYEPDEKIPRAAYEYLRSHLASPAHHKIYQDHGTLELDAKYAPYQKVVNQIILDKGFSEKGAQPNFMTRVFEGTGHNERAWADRLDIPILFLLRH
jgi:enterochelin esterase-like enzyme/lysophospholipase L1-like esterase